MSNPKKHSPGKKMQKSYRVQREPDKPLFFALHFSLQETFIAVGGNHAGLLPLAGEEIGALNLFPPLRAAARLP